MRVPWRQWLPLSVRKPWRKAITGSRSMTFSSTTMRRKWPRQGFCVQVLEHKAFSDLGIWNSSTENYYYRRIYRMVSEKIMPKIWVVAKLMLRSPQTAIYWGSYLMKICDETKSLCMQFECSDEQHSGLFGHRVSGNQPKHRPSAETLGSGRHRLAAYVGRSRQRAG